MIPRLLGLLFLCAMAGCGPAQKRADLIFVNGAEPETLDPSIITGQPEGRIVNALFEGLTTFNAQGKIRPWNGRVLDDFRGSARPTPSRSDRMQNGATAAALTAHDFVDSWKRTLSPETAASYNYQLFYVKNAESFAEGRITDFSQVGVRALDDHTLEVTLENPTPFFLDLCATPPLQPVPVDRIKEFGDDWVKPGKIVSNGAYVLEDWRINERIRLRKNSNYWNSKKVALESVEALPISVATVAFNFYAGGLADLIVDKNLTPNALLDELKKTPAFHSAPFLGIYFLRFNCSKPPFNDARVRRAFAMAVDKRRIVEKITRAGELPATSFVPPGIDGLCVS